MAPATLTRSVPSRNGSTGPVRYRFNVLWFVLPVLPLLVAAVMVWLGTQASWSLPDDPPIEVAVDGEIHQVDVAPEGGQTIYAQYDKVRPQCRWVDRATGEPFAVDSTSGMVTRKYADTRLAPIASLPATSGDLDVSCKVWGRTESTPLRIGAAPNVFDLTDGVRNYAYGIAAMGGTGLVGLVVMLAVWLRRRPA